MIELNQIALILLSAFYLSFYFVWAVSSFKLAKNKASIVLGEREYVLIKKISLNGLIIFNALIMASLVFPSITEQPPEFRFFAFTIFAAITGDCFYRLHKKKDIAERPTGVRYFHHGKTKTLVSSSIQSVIDQSLNSGLVEINKYSYDLLERSYAEE